MLRTIFTAGFGFVLLSGTLVLAQEGQTGAPAQPTSSIYNRMRRFPGQPTDTNQQQQTTQTQQFPGGSQFPPEQQGQPMQRPPMQFPHGGAPPQQQNQQSQPTPQPANTQSAVQQPPQNPYGLALQPPNPPKISYAGGQLTVTADNSSLPDILNNVVRVTGAHLEGTPPPDSERVFGHFGPGTPRDVLNDLLTGSRYDYILVGALDDPGTVRQVMLSPHGSSLEGAASNQARNQPVRQEQDEENNEPVITPQQVYEPPPPPPPQANPTTEPAPGQQQQVKTPEQLLQELQRLRQQQQQQQPDQTPH